MTTRQRRLTFTVSSLTVEGSVIVHNLGVFFDYNLDSKQHISNICRTCYFHLRQLRTVRRSLPPDILETLLHAFVLCRLDYCNSLFAGLPACDIARLQSVQNTAARFFCGISMFESVQPVLRDILHWLPVCERITFKLALLTYKGLHVVTKSYLTDMLVPVA